MRSPSAATKSSYRLPELEKAHAQQRRPAQQKEKIIYIYIYGFTGGTVVKNLPARLTQGDAREVGLIPGSGRSRGVGNGNPLQYSFLENSMDRGAWWVTVHGVAESRT